MEPTTVADVFRQIIDGDDIPKIDYLLKHLSADQAATKLDDWPYSILTNLEHADFWQRVWLARLTGTKRPSLTKDWREPLASEFESIRSSFLANLALAHKIALSSPFEHKSKDDDTAVKTLIALAVHDAYHIGQMKLMARLLSGSTSE